ncbi:thiol-disulfide oxidoreductase ResA [Pullulanibacillus sp. KACC 23026]|uniref:thiol-disulfide oxidoreductase ResA n=1 Tax=Pullulanibacillus sp. KACC 23026 TaxID=3028315 RepID=UPI0023B1BA41|nr:thiol-disulfide oxidoreductase ResA [Pullulanibacillus sp. KACC 23026]WEG12552.1 thiol-disulfide oxidoreductase ResA [Pullulanibacillus sp. KACC 23026]
MLNRRMRLFIRTIILVIVVVAIGFTVYQVVKGKQEINVGDTAPNFELQDLSGKNVQLADYRGQGVLLNFWGSWCDPCKAEMPYINKALKSGIKGVTVLGVNIQESPITVRSFLENNDLDIPVVLDSKGLVTDKYNIGPIPTTFVIDKNGKVVKKIVGSMTSVKEVEQTMKLVQP